MMECIECGATFPRNEAATPAFGDVACPACGASNIRDTEISTPQGAQNTSANERVPSGLSLPRIAAEPRSASGSRLTMICTNCRTTFPRSEVATPSFGELACPACEANDIREIEIPSDAAVEETTIDHQETDRGPAVVTYDDIGGLDSELERVHELIDLPIRHPELFGELGIEPPKGLLLYGPPGTGKSLIAKAVATETEAYFRLLSGPEIPSKYYGESEEQLREVFEVAKENAPSIVVIDEIDSITPKREDSGDIERRIVAQLLGLMDGLGEREGVVVIGTTNRVDAIDPALRRPGRFDRELEIGVPDEAGRREILRIHTRRMPLDAGIDIGKYAVNTHGFVGADLESLAKESAMGALRRLRPDLDLETESLDAATLDSLHVNEADFRTALKNIEPSALREVFVEVPDVTWDDIGGLDEAKRRLQRVIQWPLEYPDAFEQVDLRPTTGVLLYGPPGTGKTLLAKAVANEAQSNFISIKGPELLDRYVGESERGIRDVFSKARENAPTVVFFDEIDAIAGERGQQVGDAGVGERVVSQLLTELDGLETLEDVVVLAATNRPDLIDDALVRPGRLDRHVHVAPPDEDARREIFVVHTRHRPLAEDIDLDDFAARTDGYVGADLEAVCREAAALAVEAFVQSTDVAPTTVSSIELTAEHFEQAFEEIEPSAVVHTERFDR